MEVVRPQVVIETPLDSKRIYAKLELCGRVAYKSEGKIGKGSSERFLRSLIKRGHESVLEHENITVRFICDRGVTHQLVRHRLAAYTQESTNINYSSKGFQFIRPQSLTGEAYNLWETLMIACEGIYNALIASGYGPKQARSVLPNSLKTEIVTTMNIRQWRHVLRIRTSKAAHPDIRRLMTWLLQELKLKLPVLFEDIPVSTIVLEEVSIV